MISHNELADLVTMIDGVHTSVQHTLKRLDGLEEALVEVNTEFQTAVSAVTQLEGTVNTVAENAAPRKDFEHFLRTNHEKFEYLGSLISEITGMRVRDALIPTRFGERVAKLEAENSGIKREFVHVLSDILTALGEIQGQISDPIHKTRAIDRLRDDVRQRRQSLDRSGR